MRHLLCFVALSAILSCVTRPPTVPSEPNPDGPATDAPAPSNAGGQEVFFELRYINHAKGYTHRGWLVGFDGAIRAYDASGAGPFANKTSWEDAEAVELALRHVTQELGKVDGRELGNMRTLIGAASQGDLTKAKNRCFDYGTYYFLAYHFDKATQSYRPVLLYQVGDWARKNSAPEAAQITQWMHSLDNSLANLTCGPE